MTVNANTNPDLTESTVVSSVIRLVGKAVGINRNGTLAARPEDQMIVTALCA